MAQYKDGNYIVKNGEIYEVQIDIPRMMGAEVIHVALKDFKKQTNGDKIRSMSNEELARFLSATEFKRCDYRPVQEYDFAVWLEWLRKEAEDG